MLSRIKQLCQGPPEVAANPEDAKQRLQLATCVVLLEVARSDDEFCEDERRHIVATIRNRFDLSEDDAQNHHANRARHDGHPHDGTPRAARMPLHCR